ncbi:hypothetical protein Lal_00028541 [Lupinus albus]|nr:hypothetical protein Lal_00028541 [Lupinus albus]
MYNATCVVFLKIIENGSSYLTRIDDDVAYNTITSFEFILILHLMKEIMRIINCLCQTLHQKFLDDMKLVCTTKELIQKLRDGGWQILLKNVTLFCEDNIFLINVDEQLQELKVHEQTNELLTLSTSLDPKDVHKTFN